MLHLYACGVEVRIRMRWPSKRNIQSIPAIERESQLYIAMLQLGNWFIGMYKPEMDQQAMELKVEVAQNLLQDGCRTDLIIPTRLRRTIWTLKSCQLCYCIMPNYHLIYKKYDMWPVINLRYTPNKFVHIKKTIINNHSCSVLIWTQSKQLMLIYNGSLLSWSNWIVRLMVPTNSSNQMMWLAGSGSKTKEDHLNI